MKRLTCIFVIVLSLGCGYVPAVLSGVDGEPRQSYMRRCDNVADPQCIELFANLAGVDSVSASVMVAEAFGAVSNDREAYKAMADMAMNRLLDFNSPTADDESFIVVADRLLADSLLSYSDLLRIADARSLAMLNRVGHRAADFEIVTRGGDVASLSDFVAAAPRSLLIFYDPDCHDCAEFESHLAAVGPDSVGIVMVCPYAGQGPLWAAHAATMPEGWVVGRPADEGFEDAELYDIAFTPTVLLLDSDCKVVAKNISLSNVDAVLGIESVQ